MPERYMSGALARVAHDLRAWLLIGMTSALVACGGGGGGGGDDNSPPDTGTLQATVVDEFDAPVEGATVEATINATTRYRHDRRRRRCHGHRHPRRHRPASGFRARPSRRKPSPRRSPPIRRPTSTSRCSAIRRLLVASSTTSRRRRAKRRRQGHDDPPACRRGQRRRHEAIETSDGGRISIYPTARRAAPTRTLPVRPACATR